MLACGDEHNGGLATRGMGADTRVGGAGHGLRGERTTGGETLIPKSLDRVGHGLRGQRITMAETLSL
jgi:hypothetical protein